ncbi:hypothetical protein [Actinocatenispora rupis]|uniref:Uncharacterized protein n=1 Tax=Actinocatenispora rupis TaxID=519421 RepID=A0A8J3J6I7_9ACTN|nr:hypothetical protein [Actinocatenispora rupis]GID12955.1 hypothetical protein Aru02nite_38440 [Actinocatenispora rupis]
MTTTESPVRIPANHTATRRLGHWTTERAFEVRAHRGTALLDLRSPQIPAGDVEVAVDLDHATLKLLLPEDAVVDDWNLRIDGRGKVKDAAGPATPGGRRVVLTGTLRHAEVRINRGGVAQLAAMFTREYVADLRRAHREGGVPTVDDPTRTDDRTV